MKLTLNGKSLTLHYLTIVGSTLHQLNTEQSDVDVKGVFTWEQNVINGLITPQDTLDKKNMSKEDRTELMQQLSDNFVDHFDEDLDLFEAKKFFKNAMKSEPNMLDMLYADTTYGNVLYCSKEFKEILQKRKLFLNMEQAKKRFLGMSLNTFKLGKKLKRSKDLAKSLQSLLSFKNMVLTNEYSPILEEEQRLLVMNTKKSEFSDKLVQNTKELRETFEKECNKLKLSKQKDNFEILNNLLLSIY